MEPPTPLESEKMIKDRYEKIKDQFNIDINSDRNNSFNINIFKFSTNIKITANLEKENINSKYEKIYFLEDLKNNKFLSICDSIDEVYDQIIFELKKDNKKMIKEEEDCISIIIPVEHIKVKEIEFNLFKKIKSDKDLLLELMNDFKKFKNDMSEKYNKIENDNKNLNNEINLLKSENKDLKDKINFLMDENIKLKDSNKSLENQIKIISDKIDNNNIKTNNIFSCSSSSYFDIFKSSSILHNYINGQKLICNWIKYKMNKDEIKFELIFKMSVNGYKGSDFHTFCNNKRPTLILIKSSGNKIFGGFTPLDWGKKEYPIDETKSTFIFSLNINKKFDIKNNSKYTIRCTKNEGPVFGNCDIKLGNDLRKVESYANKDSYFLSENNLELTGGKGTYESLDTEELEVFEVIY